MSLENDDLDQLAVEIRKLIESNKAFLERVYDEECDEEESETETEDETDPEDFEEL